MGMYSAEMRRMQAWFSSLKEGRKNRIFELCGPSTVVSSDVKIDDGVAKSADEFDVGTARRRGRELWDVSKGGASFYGLVRLWGFGGDSVARESTHHVIAFYYSRLGNTRCYCAARKRKRRARR